MQRSVYRAGPGADEEVATRASLEHVGEVFTPHERMFQVDHPFLTDEGNGLIPHKGRLGRVVDRGVLNAPVVYFGLYPKTFRLVSGDRRDPLFKKIADFRIE